jgi:hypothetical protein
VSTPGLYALEFAQFLTQKRLHMAVQKTDFARLRRTGRNFNTYPTDTAALIKDCTAFAVWCYLLEQSEGWIVRVADIQNRFGIGRDKCRKALNNLRDLGLLWDDYPTTVDGRLAGRELVISSEQNPDALKTRQTANTDRLKNRQTEKPSDGKYGPLTKDQDLTKDQGVTNTTGAGQISTDSQAENPFPTPIENHPDYRYLAYDQIQFDSEFEQAARKMTGAGADLMSQWFAFTLHNSDKRMTREQWLGKWFQWDQRFYTPEQPQAALRGKGQGVAPTGWQERQRQRNEDVLSQWLAEGSQQ